MLKLFLCLLLAHLIADFMLQTRKTCKDKKERHWRSPHHYMHAMMVFSFSWLVSWDVCFWRAALLISIAHFFIDIWKSYRDDEISWFVLDQIAHVSVIAAMSRFWCLRSDWHMPFDIAPYYVAVAVAVLVCWKPANIFIKLMLKHCSVGIQGDKDSDFNAGGLIGTIERWLTLIFVCLQRYDALGLLIAAKSIIRFSEAQNNRSEYVLAGTLLSIFIAVLAGMLVMCSLRIWAV